MFVASYVGLGDQVLPGVVYRNVQASGVEWGQGNSLLALFGG